MAKSGPIIIVEDDMDDQAIFESIFNDLNIKNELIWFTNGPDAFRFLKATPEQPFIILSDVNLPGQTGIEFKRKIDEDPQLRKKSIPFVFLSTSIDQRSVNTAYSEMTVQGYFQKSNTYEDLKKILRMVLDYWNHCRHPNSNA